MFAARLADLEVVLEAGGEVGYDEPSLWWTADRAWLVRWEVDSDATYVACSDSAARDLLAADIGAHRVDQDDAITGE